MWLLTSFGCCCRVAAVVWMLSNGCWHGDVTVERRSRRNEACEKQGVRIDGEGRDVCEALWRSEGMRVCTHTPQVLLFDEWGAFLR